MKRLDDCMALRLIEKAENESDAAVQKAMEHNARDATGVVYFGD